MYQFRSLHWTFSSVSPSQRKRRKASGKTLSEKPKKGIREDPLRETEERHQGRPSQRERRKASGKTLSERAKKGIREDPLRESEESHQGRPSQRKRRKPSGKKPTKLSEAGKSLVFSSVLKARRNFSVSVPVQDQWGKKGIHVCGTLRLDSHNTELQ